MLIPIEGWWLPDFHHIDVRVARPGVWWWRGAPWARLKLPVTPPPKSASEGLRWMVAQLDANLRVRGDWPPAYQDPENTHAPWERAASQGQLG